MGAYYFTRIERLAIMRVCIELAGADGDLCSYESDVLNDIARDIELTDADMLYIRDVDFEEAASVIADLSDYEKDYVRGALIAVTKADGDGCYDEGKYLRMIGLLGEL